MNIKENERNYVFDNLKCFLIFLVVFGHIIEPYINIKQIYKCIYIIIYSFHMPLFIFISGYFSKNLQKSREQALKKIIVPYLLYNTLYSILINKTFAVSIFQPIWIYWFLMSLFFWKVFINEFVELKHGLLIAIGFSLYAGIFNDVNRFMSLSRTIVFFPYFICGYYCTIDNIKNIRKIPKWICSIILFISILLVLYFFVRFNIPVNVLYGADSYSLLGIDKIKGILIRSSLYLIAIITSLCVIGLVPENKISISYIGKYTLPIYIFHPYIKIITEKIIDIHTYSTITSVIILILISILTIVILGNKYLLNMTEFKKINLLMNKNKSFE